MISNDVKEIIRNSGVDGIDPKYVFSYGLPHSIQSQNLNKIVILVNDIARIPSGFGSDDIISDDGTVQVQFFYPVKADGDLTALYERPIRNLLRKNGWFQTIGGGIDRDPSTSQLYSTYHFKKTIY